MSAATRSPGSSDWRAFATLGEQLVSTTSLGAQRDRIIKMTRRLVAGKVDVWLHESLFRLPDRDEELLFPPEPELEEMREAFQSGKRVIRTYSQETLPMEFARSFRSKNRGSSWACCGLAGTAAIPFHRKT